MEIFLGFLFSILAVFAGVVTLLLLAPFFKGKLMNHPRYPGKFALFTKVEPNHAKIRMRGGRAISIIRGVHENVPVTWSSNILWSLYQRYVYWLIGMHVIGIPLIQTIYTYKLPRYRTVEIDGKKEFRVVEEGDNGFRTDHVRNELTTWYFQFSGAEVDTVPVTVKGSVQIRIREGRENDALFKTDSWNVLLDQALNGVIRSVIRTEITLDQLIGAVDRDIWKDNEKDRDNETYESVRNLIQKRLLEYEIKGELLADLIGLEIARVDIIDFSPDLTPERLAELSAPALERQAARARAIAGQGEAEYQSKVLQAISENENPELAIENLKAEAFVKAAKAGSLDALAAGLLKILSSK